MSKIVREGWDWESPTKIVRGLVKGGWFAKTREEAEENNFSTGSSRTRYRYYRITVEEIDPPAKKGKK